MSRRPKFKHAFVQPVKTGGDKLDQMRAAYQYLLDHSVPGRGGMFKATVHIRNFDYFMIKVRSRASGVYRVVEDDAKKEFELFEKEYATWKVEKVRGENMGKRISGIDSRGTIQDRFVLWIYRLTRDYLQR